MPFDNLCLISVCTKPFRVGNYLPANESICGFHFLCLYPRSRQVWCHIPFGLQKILAAHGAAKVSAYVTHGIFPNRSWERFKPDTKGIFFSAL